MNDENLNNTLQMILQNASNWGSESYINNIEEFVTNNSKFKINSLNLNQIKLIVEKEVNSNIDNLKSKIFKDANNFDYINMGSQLKKILSFLKIINSNKMEVYITWVNGNSEVDNNENKDILHIIQKLFNLRDDICFIKDNEIRNKFKNKNNLSNFLKFKIGENIMMIIKTKNKTQSNNKILKINSFIWISKIFPYLTTKEYLKLRSICFKFKELVIVDWFRLIKDQIINDLLCKNISLIAEKQGEITKFIKLIKEVYKKILKQILELIDWKYIYEEILEINYDNIIDNENNETFKIDKDNEIQVRKLKLLLLSIKKLTNYDLIEINNLDWMDNDYFTVKKELIMNDFLKDLIDISINDDDNLIIEHFKIIEFKNNFINNSDIWLEDETISNNDCLRILRFVLRFIQQIYLINNFEKPIIFYLKKMIDIAKELSEQGFSKNKKFFENFFEFNLIGKINSNKNINTDRSWENQLFSGMKNFTQIIEQVQKKFLEENFLLEMNNQITNKINNKINNIKESKLKFDLIIKNENNKKFKIYMDKYIKKYFVNESLNKLKLLNMISNFKTDFNNILNSGDKELIENESENLELFKFKINNL